MTKEDELLALVCISCSGGGYSIVPGEWPDIIDKEPCLDCVQTGKRFPTLVTETWVDCWGGNNCPNKGKGHHQCRRWIPGVTEGKLLEILLATAQLELAWWKGMYEIIHAGRKSKGDTLKEALVAAILTGEANHG